MSRGVTAAIHFELREDVAVVRIDRPETRNSLTLDQMRALHEKIAAAERSSARCVMLTGCADAFCAGRDLKADDIGGESTLDVMTSIINPLLRAVRDIPVPTVAAVQGPALGLGLGLALSCDITWVADNATFGSPFRHFGGVLDSGGHYFLSRRLGPHRAAELIFTGRLIDGREAARIGLVNKSLAASELEEEAWRLCRHIASGPTGAFKASKQILARDVSFAEVLALEARFMDEALKGPDGREGLRAFRDKRRPVFTGA